MQASNRRRRLLASRSAGHLGLHFPPCRIRFCRAAFMLRVQHGFARLRAGESMLTQYQKYSPLPLAGGNIFGAPAGIRTLDTRLKRAVLYLLSYWGSYMLNFFRSFLTQTRVQRSESRLIKETGFGDGRFPRLAGSGNRKKSGDVAGMAGLEPTISESKSGVLPLHYIPLSLMNRGRQRQPR